MMYDFFNSSEEFAELMKITNYVEDAEILPTQSYQIGLQLAEAEREYNLLHEKRKATEAEKYWNIKQTALKDGTKLTIKDMDSMVESDETINKLKEQEINAKYEADKLRAAANAVNQKAMLLQGIIKMRSGGMQ